MREPSIQPCVRYTESNSFIVGAHQLPGCSVSTSRSPGCRSNTPPNTIWCMARRLIHPPDSSCTSTIASGPFHESGLPAPECVVSTRLRSSHVAQNGSHAASL